VLGSSLGAEHNLAVSHLLYHLIMMSVVHVLMAATLPQIRFIIPLRYSMETFRMFQLYFLSAPVTL